MSILDASRQFVVQDDGAKFLPFDKVQRVLHEVWSHAAAKVNEDNATSDSDRAFIDDRILSRIQHLETHNDDVLQ